MLESLNPQPQDKILALIALYRDDPRTTKIDLGVGGDDTWGAPVLPEYTVKNETKHFSFYFKGI